MQDLTKDAYRLLVIMYKEYLTKRNHGVRKSDAALFGSSTQIQRAFVPRELPEDVNEYLLELEQSKYVSCLYGNDLVDEVMLTSKAIITMEQRIPNGIKQASELLSVLPGLIPL